MGLLEIGIMMAVMSAGSALGPAILILTKEEKAPYKEWGLRTRPPALSNLSSGQFPLVCMTSYLLRLLFLCRVRCYFYLF